MSDAFFYRIGALFPTKTDGTPNILLSPSLTYDASTGVIKSNDQPLQALDIDLSITTNPVIIKNIDKFVNDYLLGSNGLTTIKNLDGTVATNSLFNKYQTTVVGKWTTQARNRTLYALLLVGYQGLGADQAWNKDAFWSGNGGTATTPEEQALDAALLAAIKDLNNYDPAGKWGQYQGDEVVRSTFDLANLLPNIDSDPNNDSLWLPNFLYTYGIPGTGDSVETSYPGPTLMLQPGEDLKIDFENALEIPGLTLEQIQAATLVPNSSYGNGSSGGLGGTVSTNFHFHGAHSYPGGFSDNVVSRYTTGQSWTTTVPIPEDHGIGSYWYHPHYHPSVNTQVYAGQSGFIQIGDPLSRIPSLSEVPRNLAILKNIDLDFGTDSAQGENIPSLRLTSFDSLGGLTNRLTMVTVNGEFQPERQATGGWQVLTISNQSNQSFYNVRLQKRSADGLLLEPLPLFIYGEDGHQYPEIRRAANVLGTYTAPGSTAPTEYANAQDIISVAPGKRMDILFYLESGTTELTSLYSFLQDGKLYRIVNMGGYPDLSSLNENTLLPTFAAGPVAILTVPEGTPDLTAAQQEAFVTQVNTTIPVQEISPTTSPEDYDPSKVPAVNLFDSQWQPTRGRVFNWAKNALVGADPSERDAPTQMALEGKDYKTYTTLPKQADGTWLGYEQPFLINDHVFPNAPLVTAQLGTIEEWELKNWSIGGPAAYIGHPFHIHINDYQVLDSDTELSNRRNLEDVTMLNSSGYHFYDTKTGQIKKLDPLEGTFTSIPEALDPNTVGTLSTFGANNQTVRMLFQDFLGTYVFHCHILPHEDAGMMMAIQVIENMKDSWLIPAEHFAFERNSNGVGEIGLYRANDFEPRTLAVTIPSSVIPQRAQVGDLSSDFVQEVVISSQGDGLVRVYDGQALLNQQSQLLSTLQPYPNSPYAPWALVADVNGDNRSDLTTAGFEQVNTDGTVSIHEFTVTGWRTETQGQSWVKLFDFDPWDFLPHHGPGLDPLAGLTAEQVSFSIGDYNLDNFNDLAIVYRTTAGVHLSILDGAAIALLLQTGQFEGGYAPDQALLADALIEDDLLAQATEIILTSGFNQFGQIALENLLLTANAPGQTGVYTFQLEAGHFIATSNPADIGGDGSHGSHGTNEPSNPSNNHGGHGSGVVHAGDEFVTNLNGNIFPLHLVETNLLAVEAGEGYSVTPIFAGAQGNGALLLQAFETAPTTSPSNPQILFATGNAVNGTPSSGSSLLGNTQQLALELDNLRQISADDLDGIGGGIPTDATGQANLTRLLYQAYYGRLSDPTGTADWAAQLPSFSNVAAFVTAFTSSPESQAEIAAHFGGSLDSRSVAQIVTTTSETLFSRNPTPTELARWETLVAQGLPKSQLPLAILQATVADFTSFQPTDNKIPITDPNPNVNLVDTLNNTDNNTFTISGAIYREAAFNNTVGFYRVLDSSGTVRDANGNTYQPGSAQYQSVALSPLNRLTDSNANLTLPDLATVPFSFTIQGDELFALFMAVQGSATTAQTFFFAYRAANSDNFDHVTNLGNDTWGFEDILGGGDLDYDDAIVNFNIDDRNRASFLSASAQWSDAQWANNANLYGSFGQGLENASDRFQILNQTVTDVGYLGSSNAAQVALDDFITSSLELLSGSEVSQTGFF